MNSWSRHAVRPRCGGAAGTLGVETRDPATIRILLLEHRATLALDVIDGHSDISAVEAGR